MKRKKNKLILSAVAALTASIPLQAQDALSFLNETNSQIRSAGSGVYDVVIAVLAIIALISLVNVAIKLNEADNQATNKAIAWCGGIIFCLIGAMVLRNFMGV